MPGRKKSRLAAGPDEGDLYGWAGSAPVNSDVAERASRATATGERARRVSLALVGERESFFCFGTVQSA